MLGKIDKKLLLNAPDLWSTRFHWMFPVSIGFAIVLAVLSWISLPDLRSRSGEEFWIALLLFLAFVVGIIWMVFLFRFNVFKQYGRIRRSHYLLNFILFFLTIFLITFWAFIPSIMETGMAKWKYPAETMKEETQRVHYNLLLLHKDILPREIQEIRYRVVQDEEMYKAAGERLPQNDDKDYSYISLSEYIQTCFPGSSIPENGQNVHIVEKWYAKGLMDSANIQSMVFLDSNRVIVRKYPDYALFYYPRPIFSLKNYTNRIQMKTNRDIYDNLVCRENLQIEKDKVESDIKKIINKYSDPVTNSTHEGEKDWRSVIRRKYDLEPFEQGIIHLERKHNRFQYNGWKPYIYALYIISLMAALLLFLFRHNDNRDFFRTVLGWVILFFFTVTLLILRVFRGEDVFLCILLGYFILFLGLSLSGIGKNRFRFLSRFGLNGMIVFTPFMPLILSSLYFDYYENVHRTNLSTDYYDKVTNCNEWWFWSGAIFLPLLIHFVFGPWLRRNYAQPKL